MSFDYATQIYSDDGNHFYVDESGKNVQVQNYNVVDYLNTSAFNQTVLFISLIQMDGFGFGAF